MQEMDDKIKMKEDPWCLEGRLIEIKSETEDHLRSESNTIICDGVWNTVQIKEEPVGPKSEEEEEEEEEAAVESENSFPHREDIKIDIKEEALLLDSSTGVQGKQTVSGAEELLVLASSVEQTSRLCAELKCSDSCATNSHLKLGNSDPENNYTQPHVEVTKPKNTAALGAENSSSIHSNGKKPHKCDRCYRRFASASNLNAHKLIHSNGKKLHKCDICEKSFASASSLNEHKLIHSNGKKLHKCDICEKSFASASSLNDHKLIHEAETQYKCDICERNFISLISLRYHKPRHHEGKKPQKCQICGKTYVYLSRLKSHKLLHDIGKQNQCNICGKDFMSPLHLRRHEILHDTQKAKGKLDLSNCYIVIYRDLKVENMQNSSQ